MKFPKVKPPLSGEARYRIGIGKFCSVNTRNFSDVVPEMGMENSTSSVKGVFLFLQQHKVVDVEDVFRPEFEYVFHFCLVSFVFSKCSFGYNRRNVRVKVDIYRAKPPQFCVFALVVGQGYYLKKVFIGQG